MVSPHDWTPPSVTERAIIPAGKPNRPGTRLADLRTVTIHETANMNRGANAAMHRNFVHNGGGSGMVSFHFVVDDHSTIQLLPLIEVGWHAGTTLGNATSIGIEICVNVDGNFAEAVKRAAKLAQELILHYELPVEAVIQHNAWYGKDCPRQLRANRGASWAGFIEMVRPTSTPPDALYFPQTGKYLGVMFRELWDRYGLALIGYPLTLPTSENNLLVQYCENVRLEYNPNQPKAANNPRIGAAVREYLDLKRERGDNL